VEINKHNYTVNMLATNFFKRARPCERNVIQSEHQTKIYFNYQINE